MPANPPAKVAKVANEQQKQVDKVANLGANSAKLANEFAKVEISNDTQHPTTDNSEYLSPPKSFEENTPTDAIAPNKNNGAIKETDNSEQLTPAIDTQSQRDTAISQSDNADLIYTDQDLRDLFGRRDYMRIDDFMVGGTQAELDALLKKGRIQIVDNPDYIALGHPLTEQNKVEIKKLNG